MSYVLFKGWTLASAANMWEGTAKIKVDINTGGGQEPWTFGSAAVAVMPLQYKSATHARSS